ncbi:hypothetical protein E3P77_00829 [Wallemia ichthyophaga]|uniref:N(6)-L-threonylcarbamoyladenine synthase n=1 Tax=Wallemia ichthyophaga TaxID=245174 RepID=A0A4T0J736_WALIC|nr:hypothetical protein E3P98_00823 [Wallemia ichthyophaga]TIA95809.1 hypothetical protein E3P95_03530 [Wallemia ichthyophaga]TIA96832.1 hypothetical protein E3P94_03537 [Wallemia ichthyophaga]TIB14368.1 hypothetical protein E3P90_01343 [Wallemia ichthyophaga]TIB16231.1 hypothetical protein E3P93_01094 [Wallemia ichthyophaga]
MRRSIFPVYKDVRRRLILALESSADDTCAAIVSNHREILSNVVMKQDQIHEQYGGIHPLYATQGHMKNISPAISEAIRRAGVAFGDLDAIATTEGPGMKGCLQIAMVAAKSLVGVSGIPLVGVHHMQAHALTCCLTEENPPQFPFYTLLCSGGHTMIVDAEDVTKMRVLATTNDDSIGNAFDHAAKLLNIPWSGKAPGAALEGFARHTEHLFGHKDEVDCRVKEYRQKLRVPAPSQLLFSYSGLRSAFSRLVDESDGGDVTRVALARAFQSAAVAQLADKVTLALSKSTVEPSSLVVSGGVASNGYLRERLSDVTGRHGLNIYFPAPALCTGGSDLNLPLANHSYHIYADNAAMIAWAAHYKLAKGELANPATLMPRAKWSLEDM